MQGRGPWMASCIYVCKHESVSVCDFIRLCVCVCVWGEARDYFQKLSSTACCFITATKRPHGYTECRVAKTFFFVPSRSSLPSSVRPSSSSSSSLSSMVTVGMGINICQIVFLCNLGFRGEAELDLSNFEYEHEPMFLQLEATTSEW